MLIAVHQQFSASLINVDSNLELLWLLCHAAPRTVLVGVCYRPPQNDPDFSYKLNNVLSELTSSYPNADIVLFGDFNFPTIDWRNYTSMTNSSEAKNFVDVCLNFNLTQLILEPTRIAQNSANTLDLILTNSPDSATSITYLREISDHKVIHATFSFTPMLRQVSRKTIRLYERGDFQAINEELTAFFTTYETDFHTKSLNENWTIFRDKVHELTNKYIPVASFRANQQKPWFTTALKRLENKKKRHYRAAKRNPSQASWEKYYTAEADYLAAIRNAKHTFFHSDLPKMLIHNPKKFWHVVNPKDTRTIVLTNDMGQTISDCECADIFNRAFSTVFAKECDLPANAFISSFTASTMDPVSFFADGISSRIENIKLTSSAGIDEINSKFLKNTKHISAAYLSLLYSQSLSSGNIPHDWKVGKVVPIFKSGNKNSPLNYRPISLTSIPCKIMEHVIYSQVMNFSIPTISFIHHNMASVKTFPVRHNWLHLFMTYMLTLTATNRLMLFF